MEISSASFYDIVTLEATYRAQYLESFKCEERLEKNILNWMSQGREYPPQVRIDLWTEKCRGAMDLNFGKITYKRCLCNFKNPSFGFYMTLFNAYKLGMLPFEGSVADQPASIMEIFNVIQGLDVERQEAEYKKQKNQPKSKSKRR